MRRPPAAGSTPPESGEGRPARRPPAGGPTTPPGRPTGRRPDAAARPTDRPSPKRRRPEAPQEPLSAGEPAEESGSDGEERQAKAPWHFKFIVVGSVVYLGWRLYQGISWLAHHI